MTESHYPHLQALREEPPAIAEVRIRQGAPRLFVNGVEKYPMLAWSWRLVDNTRLFKQAGVDMLHPILGLNAIWQEDGTFDFSPYDQLFDRLLDENPDAFFLPRLLFDVPMWWKLRYPNEMIKTALPVQPDDGRQYRDVITNDEGGWLWGIQLDEPSLASDVWRSGVEKALRALLQHLAQSSLRSRIIGYQIGAGIYGEWHYFLSEFVPDFSAPAQRKLGYVPDLEARVHTSFGLLRDPAKEQAVIDYYRRFHEELCAETVLDFARIVKEESEARLLCGVFYGYQLENVWMHEGGHLAPEKILRSPLIDFLASPYSYQTSNIEGRQWWEHDVVDGAGNWLGRARGIAGDGGYRVLLESLRRNGKLYFVELDAGTYLEPPPIHPDGSGGTAVERELCMIGGAGSTTVEGTRQILRRDLGQVFVRGNGGWLFDFGPVLRTKRSWYADQPILDEISKLVRLGEARKTMDLSSCAQIAAVYDARSLFVTRHWRAEAPFNQGGHNLDYFTRWFADSQVRALHRIGAPLDFLYRFDLQPDDPRTYRLLFMVNLFYLSADEVFYLREILRDSGATVVWFYAPGLVTSERIDLEQMQELSGFRFKLLEAPGSMLIDCDLPDGASPLRLRFGVQQEESPRFAVVDEAAETLGVWLDSDHVAFARKQLDGWQSVYLGSAPAPVEVLRWLARQAGATLWSTAADNVMATRDCALLVATSDGKRTLALPKPMRDSDGGPARQEHQLDLKMGDVQIFLA